jgi:hypothetical protein
MSRLNKRCKLIIQVLNCFTFKTVEVFELTEYHLTGRSFYTRLEIAAFFQFLLILIFHSIENCLYIFND